MLQPTYAEFKALATRGNLIPVVREINADLETPISVYLKLRGNGESFLLESVEGGERLARYSFLGANPARVLTLHRGQVATRNHAQAERLTPGDHDPLGALREFLAPYQAVPVAGLPRFFGGAVGYLSYDIVRHIERLPDTARDELGLPEAMFLLTDTLVAFDHVKHRALVIANAHLNGDPRAAYGDAVARIESTIARLRRPLPAPIPVASHSSRPLESNTPPERFGQIVERAQEYIASGDIFQVVLSQRFICETQADPFSTYRALRRLNPSPYMFFLDLGETQLIGSSPEMLVRLEDGLAQLNPIAGTRPRGADEAEDTRLERELRDDPKERAEHVMLVDLGRLAPTHIVISPGPGGPADGGISNAVIREFYRAIPILGVCLGHQCIGHVFGGVVARAPRLMHGKTSVIYHEGRGLFEGIPNPFEAGRYHSPIVKEPLPDALRVTAFAKEGEVMGIRHKQYPLEGVQFHPESILTKHGRQILKNFLDYGGQYYGGQ